MQCYSLQATQRCALIARLFVSARMLIGAVQDVGPCEMGLEVGKRQGRAGRPGGGQAVVEGEEMKFVAAAVEGAGDGGRGCLEGVTRFPVLAARRALLAVTFIL